ncbi:Lysosomal alpha-mannosidase [Halotydeus destructor]|nr:Lysosomal alpha-mannosidase [Halotydeus destructor]
MREFKLTSFICFIILATSHGGVIPGQNFPTTCGYQSCPKVDHTKLNIHLVPHTHDDVGWLKTVDQYYYGSRNGIQNAGVQYIIDSVIGQLILDPSRRFIYVETAFFHKWWQDQDVATKLIVAELVQQGRLEFIGGGWSMNDEATVHYMSTIDQMTLGHQVLKDTFGQCAVPRVAWQIDPFGHSREMASLFAQMGFDGLFFGRLDYHEKEDRQANRTMEMVWHGSRDLGAQGDLFTGANENGYNPPDGFCFDIMCSDEPIIDDPSSGSFNVDQRVADFMKAVYDQRDHFQSSNIMMTMGSDFQYQNANTWYKNLDLLIKYVRERHGSEVNIFYSTPSCYLYALNQANQTWPTKGDDFFPYASDPHAFWTGYFSSRPATKYYERRANNYLQVVKQLQTMSGLTGGGPEHQVDTLRQAMGIMQHHDAVAGTEKQQVNDDYVRVLTSAVQGTEQVIGDSLGRFMAAQETVAPPEQLFCHNLNISECSVTETEDRVAVTIYNPRPQIVSPIVRLPWSGDTFSVFSPHGTLVKAELVDIPAHVRSIPGRSSKATQELVFKADLDVSPNGFATFFVDKKPSGQGSSYRTERLLPTENEVTFSGKTIKVNFDSVSGELRSIKMADGRVVKVQQDFRYYEGMQGNNSGSDARASGAYIFRPNGQKRNPSKPTEGQFFVRGRLVSEVHQTWSEWAHQTIRVNPANDQIEFDWVIGPIPVEDNIGKEVISYFTTDLNTAGVFYTDANGRQMVKRVRNYRTSFNYENTEPISGNYYPVNSRLILKDERAGLQVAIMTDRSQGGSSIKDGAAELMVHRRCLNDDAFGVGEALDEPGYDGRGLVIRGTHTLLLSTIKDGHQHRDIAMGLALKPQLTFAPYDDVQSYLKNFKTRYQGLTRPLPANVHLLTLEAWSYGTVLLRLEHFYESTDDVTGLSKDANVTLNALFRDFEVIAALEMTLSANQVKAEAKRLKWKTIDDFVDSRMTTKVNPLDDRLVVRLQPMEIRTFVLGVARNSILGVAKESKYERSML